MSKNKAAYYRVANVKSDIADQAKTVRDHLDTNSAEELAEFADVGLSGNEVDRRALNQMLELCMIHPGTFVAVQSAERLARLESHITALQKRLKDAEAELTRVE